MYAPGTVDGDGCGSSIPGFPADWPPPIGSGGKSGYFTGASISAVHKAKNLTHETPLSTLSSPAAAHSGVAISPVSGGFQLRVAVRFGTTAYIAAARGRSHQALRRPLSHSREAHGLDPSSHAHARRKVGKYFGFSAQAPIAPPPPVFQKTGRSRVGFVAIFGYSDSADRLLAPVGHAKAQGYSLPS